MIKILELIVIFIYSCGLGWFLVRVLFNKENQFAEIQKELFMIRFEVSCLKRQLERLQLLQAEEEK